MFKADVGERPTQSVAIEQRKTILHITADYPDCNKPINTYAIKNFIDKIDDFDNYIICISRSAFPWRYKIVPGGGVNNSKLISLKYWGLPFGIFLALSMYIVARRIHSIVRRRGLHVDLIHAHKLTFEGLAAFWLSRWMRVPMVCSLRGEVEQKVLRAKPHYRPLYSAVARRAKFLYFVSAWVREEIRTTLKADAAKERLLPNFVQHRGIVRERDFAKDRLVSILVLDDKRKGLDKLLPAFRQVMGTVPNASLDLIGRGTPSTFERLRRVIQECGLQNSVRLVGPMDHESLVRRLPTYAGMVLVSRNETFGMSYVEALLSGVPILYSKGTGIDGYVDDIDAAVGVCPRSVEDIRDGLITLLKNQHAYRLWLEENADRISRRFAPAVHLLNYARDIRSILEPLNGPKLQTKNENLLISLASRKQLIRRGQSRD